VDDHPGRLVDHGQIFVLIEDLERNRLRHGFRHVRLGDLEFDDVARRYAVGGIGALPVDPDEVALDQARGGRPAQVAGMLGEKAVQPRGGGGRYETVGLRIR
jgi:hypothetical protein